VKRGDKKTANQLTENFYKKKYWNELYYRINDEKLAIRLFDVSVNIGKKRAIRILQNIIEVSCDGIFGRVTLHSVNFSDENLYRIFIRSLEYFYRSRKKFYKFGKGWLNRLHREIK
jgi:lysozyme family protein